MKITYGYCHCGCGKKTLLATRDRKGYSKGEPLLFILGHIGKLNARKNYLAKFSISKTGTPLKLCTSCKRSKHISFFNKSKTRYEGLRSHCKQCERKNAREFYHKNPKPYKQRAKVSHKKMTEENKKIAKLIKEEKGCRFCGEKTLCVLDFHHLIGNSKGKKGGMPVSRAANHSKKKFKEELAKCIVVCANCHRKIHAGLIKLND